MNIHVPQSTLATEEAKHIMYTSHHIVTPQSNSCVAGIIQDAAVSMYMLTNSWKDDTETMVPRRVAYDCYVGAGIDFDRVADTFKRAEASYSKYVKDGVIVADSIPGRLFVSPLFPADFDYTRITNTNDKHSTFKIQAGVMTLDSAPLCKVVIGERGQTIHHMLWIEYDRDRSLQFLSEVEHLAYHWLPRFGFSIGLADCSVIKPEKVTKALADMSSEVSMILATTSDSSIREHKINNALNSVMNVGPTLAKEGMNGGDRNALNVMRQSGAKGSVVNCAQMSSFVGQQNIGGKRIEPTLSGKTRTLPHFVKGDDSPAARGFIFNCYLNGLTPSETFFHAAAGRSGISDTSNKTAITGYIQKRIARQLEDLRAHFDGSVRSTDGSIVQFIYGDDGLNPKKIYSVPKVEYPFFVNPERLAMRLNHSSATTPAPLQSEVIDLMTEYISSGMPGAQTTVTQVVTDTVRSQLSKVLQGVKVGVDVVPEMCSQLRDIYESAKIEDGEMVGLIATHALGEKVTQMTLDSFHSTGSSAMDIQLGVPRLEELIRASKKSITPMCSIHIDNPVIARNATLIASLEKKNVSLKDDSPEYIANYNQIQALKTESFNTVRPFCSKFQYITVASILSSITIEHLYDDYSPERHASPFCLVEYKKHEFEWWETFQERTVVPTGWVVVLTFDKAKLFKNNINLTEIAERLTTQFNSTAECVASPEALNKIVVYIDFDKIQEYVQSKMELPPGDDVTLELMTLDNTSFFTARDVVMPLCSDTVVRGFPGIENAFPREDLKTKRWMIDTKGSNLVDVMGVDGVDVVNTTSNDLYQIYNTFGIEATKKFLFREINSVLAGYSIYVNPRHIDLLVARMTQKGELASCTENGINRDVGPIAKLSFEKPIDNAVTSSMFGENDFVQSIASSIMFGGYPKVGTGVVDVTRDENVL